MTSTPANCPSSPLDLWADEVLVDPFPVFRQLRDLGQVVFLERQSLYALPRFAEVRSTLSSWSRFSSAAGVGVDPTANSMMPESIIKSDPPRHDFHRRTLAAQLSVGSLASATHPIEQTAMQFVDAALMAESFDAVADLARPYSLTVVCDLVGIREEDRAPLPGLAEHAFNIFGPGNERLALAPHPLARDFLHPHHPAFPAETQRLHLPVHEGGEHIHRIAQRFEHGIRT